MRLPHKAPNRSARASLTLPSGRTNARWPRGCPRLARVPLQCINTRHDASLHRLSPAYKPDVSTAGLRNGGKERRVGARFV